ncbi:MAG: peptidoglycan-associated lipoprotein Pal [Nitrospirae bacterium]|nr:peptidoglycan-associated lipoprotein Pal [Nitrospirota bacterium]
MTEPKVAQAVPPPEKAVEQPAAATLAPEAPPPTSASQLDALADVFFDYDRFTIRNDAKAVLEANARLLKAEKGWKLLLEGHCDERGTADYNLVLGERRAKAVKRYLEDLGVPSSRIQTTSFGKEKPFCGEHSDACWQKNRRAHFQLQ